MGSEDGCNEGCADGANDGSEVGTRVGLTEGDVGSTVGAEDGPQTHELCRGTNKKQEKHLLLEGSKDGEELGLNDGVLEGDNEGSKVGGFSPHRGQAAHAVKVHFSSQGFELLAHQDSQAHKRTFGRAFSLKTSVFKLFLNEIKLFHKNC